MGRKTQVRIAIIVVSVIAYFLLSLISYGIINGFGTIGFLIQFSLLHGGIPALILQLLFGPVFLVAIGIHLLLVLIGVSQ